MTDTDRLARALEASWSLKSSTLWSEDVPAAGQCGVTALVANDVLGADILKTRYGLIWHFYNRIDGRRHDFTANQFERPVAYDDLPATREEAFADTNAEQYDYLRSTVLEALKVR
ncbi:YunG family protein [Roseibium sp.]|uniref:YunG family protein n=1 Tax=Roseibium sp. TaxID=1936156 RepID=UPI003BB0BE61